MLPVCYPSSPSPTTGLPEAVAYALSSVSGLTRWVDYIPVKLVGSPLGMNEQTTNLNGFVPMRLLGSAIGMNAWRDYIPVYVDNSATEAWVTSATGYIPYANSVLGAAAPSVPSFYFNLSNAVNATIADAQGNGTITTATGGNITASIVPSRTTGVAPLYVNFDCTGTTHATSGVNATHDLFYSTNFGMPSAGTWANGVQSAGVNDKNWGFGPVTGCVYETPGTYVVEMSVTDGGETKIKRGTITVLDPDAVFNPAYGAGYETICFSSTGNFTGAPAVSTKINTSGTTGTDMYGAFLNYKGNNKRLMFCKGEAWTCSAPITFTNISNLRIDGYGTGVPHTFSSGTMVSVNATSFANSESGTSMFATYTGCSDISICNIRINSVPTVFAAAVANTIDRVLFYKVEIRGCAQGWNVSASQGTTTVIPDQVCLYECLADQIYGYAYIDPPSASASGAIGTPGVFTSPLHPLKVNYKVELIGTPPAPLATGTDYWVTSDANFTVNSFALSSSYANATTGVALALSGTGTCTVKAKPRGGDVSCYVALIRGGIMGCYFDNCNHGEQNMRIPFIDRGHINNNYVSRPNQTKNVLKIHSVIHSYFPVWSEKFVIFGNVIDLRGGYSYDPGATPPTTETGDCGIIIGTGGNGNVGGEWVRNGIVESNFTYGGLGNPKSTRYFASISCPNMTVRNNIADFSVGDRTSSVSTSYIYTTISMVGVGAGPGETTSGIRIYNNTLYSNLANPESCQFIRTSGVVSDIKIKNNLWYLPNRLENFQYGLIYNDLGLATGIDAPALYNTSSHLANPHFAVMPPVALADWRPTSGYAVDGGTAVPVLRDFNNNNRIGGAYDMGAVLP